MILILDPGQSKRFIWYPVSGNQNPASTELFPEQPEDQR